MNVTSASEGHDDLATMLATFTIERRADAYTFLSGTEWQVVAAHAAAIVDEAEGPTFVVAVDHCRAVGAPVGFIAAWLTIAVHSSLQAVGLTAALSAALAERDIACNVIAGYYHDHLLVPWELADAAVAALEALRRASQAGPPVTFRDR